MQIVHRAAVLPRRLGLLPAAFNPPTRAHLALATAALTLHDEVVFVMPERLPHKELTGPTIEQRTAMLRVLASQNPRFSVAISSGGLFDEIAREAREHYPDAQLSLLCGRDAAERILEWDYGSDSFVEEMLTRLELHVASRFGDFHPPPHLQHAVHRLPINDFDECSSTAVRQALASGADWRHLVPDGVHELVERIYR